MGFRVVVVTQGVRVADTLVRWEVAYFCCNNFHASPHALVAMSEVVAVSPATTVYKQATPPLSRIEVVAI